MIEQIRAHLKAKQFGTHIIYEEEMTSTNLVAKMYGEENVMEIGTERGSDGHHLHGTLVITDRQTEGRGRRGRSWTSPEGNCYFSLLLQPEIKVENASMLTLVVALAVVKAIQNCFNLNAQIKWPNDVVFDGKKLCGILTESNFSNNDLKYVIVGVGINANQMEFKEEIANTATSLWNVLNRRIDCAALVAECLNCFEQLYETFVLTEDLSALQKEYNQQLVNCNREVRILGAEEWIGTALGIDQTGELLVRDAGGVVRTVRSGEVSVRGLYGYV